MVTTGTCGGVTGRFILHQSYLILNQSECGKFKKGYCLFLCCSESLQAIQRLFFIQFSTYMKTECMYTT